MVTTWLTVPSVGYTYFLSCIFLCKSFIVSVVLTFTEVKDLTYTITAIHTLMHTLHRHMHMVKLFNDAMCKTVLPVVVAIVVENS